MKHQDYIYLNEDYYKKQNILYEIDATVDIPSIYKEIHRIIHSLET